MAQFILDLFPDVVSQFGLIGCAMAAWSSACLILAVVWIVQEGRG